MNFSTCTACGADLGKPGVLCPVCADRHDRESRARDRLERLDKIRANLDSILAGAGVLARERAASFDTLAVDAANRRAVDAARAWAENPTGFFYLAGDAGRGKSWLMAAMLRERVLLGESALWLRETDLIERVYSGQNNDSLDRMRKIKTVRLLAVDDLGTGKVTDRLEELIYSILDFRHGAMLPTILTGNLDMTGVAARYGSRVASRLSTGQVVILSGPDRRLTK